MKRRAFLGKALDHVLPRFAQNSETGLYLPKDHNPSRGNDMPRRGFIVGATATAIALSGCPAGYVTPNLPENGCYITIDDCPRTDDPNNDGNQGNMEFKLDYVKQFNETNETKNGLTFFVEGQYCDPNTDLGAPGYPLIVRALQEGHVIGNHSYSHPHFSQITTTQANEEISSTQAIIDQAYKDAGMQDQNPRLFRFPYFDSDGATGGLRAVWCNVDPRDYELVGANLDNQQMIADKSDFLLRVIDKGDILLLHDLKDTGLYFIPLLLDNFVSYPITKLVRLTSYGLIDLGNNTPPHLSF